MSDMSQVHKFLLKSQTNELLNLIQGTVLSPEDFSWAVNLYRDTENTAISLRHSPSESIFIMLFSETGYIIGCEFSPAAFSKKRFEECGDWNYLTGYFSEWLGYMDRELNSPDLWSELSKATRLVNAASEDTDNLPFTQEERQRISENLAEIKQYLITTLSPDAARMARIEANIDYLKEASNRLGKKDWKNIFISFLLGLAMDHSDKARDIFGYAGSVLQWLYHHGTNLLNSL